MYIYNTKKQPTNWLKHTQNKKYLFRMKYIYIYIYVYIYIYIYISSCEFVNSTDLGDVRYFFKLDDVTLQYSST